jgi:hypothetical protein
VEHARLEPGWLGQEETFDVVDRRYTFHAATTVDQPAAVSGRGIK